MPQRECHMFHTKVSFYVVCACRNLITGTLWNWEVTCTKPRKMLFVKLCYIQVHEDIYSLSGCA